MKTEYFYHVSFSYNSIRTNPCQPTDGEKELSGMDGSKQHAVLVKLCTAALMTAIVFAGNYLRITLPVAVGGVTAFTLANILCALSGLLLGPWWGFLAAGLGSFLYDLTNPNYVAEAPITLVTKGMYGLVAGAVFCFFFVRLLKKGRDSYPAMVVATACAAVGYLVIYSVKNFFYNGMFIEGYATAVQCWAVVVAKLPATVVNGVLAVIFAPILGVALQKALRAAHLERVLA